MVGFLVGWLVGGLVGGLAGWLVGYMVGWLRVNWLRAIVLVGSKYLQMGRGGHYSDIWWYYGLAGKKSFCGADTTTVDTLDMVTNICQLFTSKN